MSKVRAFLEAKRNKDIKRLDKIIELNKIQEDLMDKSHFAKTYKIPPTPQQPQNTEAFLQDRVKQMEIARDNLKTMLNPDVAIQVLQDIDSAGEINEFNRFFPGVKKLLEGQSKSSLTRAIFNDIWNKAKLEMTLPDVKTQLKELKDLNSNSNAEVKNFLSSIDKNMGELKDLSKSELDNIIRLLASIRTDNKNIGDETKDQLQKAIVQLRVIQQDQWKGIEASKEASRENLDALGRIGETLNEIREISRDKTVNLSARDNLEMVAHLGSLLKEIEKIVKSKHASDSEKNIAEKLARQLTESKRLATEAREMQAPTFKSEEEEEDILPPNYTPPSINFNPDDLPTMKGLEVVNLLEQAIKTNDPKRTEALIENIKPRLTTGRNVAGSIKATGDLGGRANALIKEAERKFGGSGRRAINKKRK